MIVYRVRRFLIVALAVTLAVGTAATASANALAPDLGAHALDGSVSETDSGSFAFSPTSIHATDATTTMALALTVTDLRGTGAGWTLSMSMTRFTCDTGGCGAGETLPTSALLNVAAACAEEETCELPNESGTCSVAPDHPISDVTSDFNVCVATSGGTGTLVVTPTLTIPVPADTYAGDYTSAVTITITAN